LKKKKRASAVNATIEVADFIYALSKGGNLWKIMKKAESALFENIFAGTQVEKEKIPRHYVEEYGVSNLFVFRLDSGRRLTYTLIADVNGISVNIVEVFLDHRQYEKRFGYS
jgi:hypothetical protein